MASILECTDFVDGLFTLNDGQREMVDEDRAKALVEAGMAGRSPSSVTRVCLSNKSYSGEAAKVIAETLKTMENITEVDFSDMIAGRPEDVGLEVLEAICGGVADRDLLRVNLSDNAMGQKGIDACRLALEGKKSLQGLLMCNDGLSEAAMAAVRDILLTNASGEPIALRTLHFFNNMSGDGGAKALAEVLPHCPCLEDLRFSGSRAGREGSATVVKALLLCPAVTSGLLVRLDLADNTFGVEGGQDLAKALSEQSGLTYINLRDCSLEDNGAEAIAEALSGTAPGLRSMDFSGNDITAEGAGAVAACVGGKEMLEYLGMEENEIGTKGARHVALALRSTPSIRRVQLSTNEIGTRGAVEVALSLKSHEHLESLEMNGNGISEEGLVHIRRVLESAQKLDVLGEMDDNDEDFVDEDDDDVEDDGAVEGGGRGGEGGGKEGVLEGGDGMDELTAAMGGVTV